ncbi:MAG: class I SAM-dependent methyltransferase [Candidatus Eisenbacteria bacterium]|nr:class I SAM-dependent methyltransferase [Candidatus Eisenbacteria bacterium]
MEFTGERLVPGVEGLDELFLEHVSRYAFAAPLTVGKRVLDAGCGCGYGSYHLARAGAASVLGIDVSEEAIAYCRENHPHDAVAYERRDVLETGLEAGSFDRIVAFEVFEHVDRPERFLDEMKRLLRPDGALVLSTPNAHTYEAGGEGGDNPYHVKEYVPEEMRALLEGRFGRVDWYVQGPASGLSILPVVDPGEKASLSAEMRLIAPPDRSGWGAPVPVAAKLERCSYMVALCRMSGAEGFPSPGAICIALGDDLADGSGRAAALVQHGRRLQQQLDERGRWALDLQRELELRDKTIEKLQAEFEDRTRWALELDRKTEEQARLIQELTRERAGAGPSAAG